MDTTRRITHTAPGPVPLTLRIASGRIGVHADPTHTATAVVLTAPERTCGAAAVAAAVVDHEGGHMTVETPAILTPAAADAAQIIGPRGEIAIGPAAVVVAGRIGSGVHIDGSAHRDTRPGSFDHTVGASATVPAASSIYARTDGVVLLFGPLSEADIVSDSAVSIQRAARATVTAITGDISIDSADELTAITHTGNVTATVHGPASLAVADRGDITVHVHAAAHISATTAHGDITVHAHVLGVTTELSAPHGTVRVHTTR